MVAGPGQRFPRFSVRYAHIRRTSWLESHFITKEKARRMSDSCFGCGTRIASLLRKNFLGASSCESFCYAEHGTSIFSCGKSLAPASRLGQNKKNTPPMVRYFSWLRDQDSNLGPRGYEPRELPLLHPAITVIETKPHGFFSSRRAKNVVFARAALFPYVGNYLSLF